MKTLSIFTAHLFMMTMATLAHTLEFYISLFCMCLTVILMSALNHFLMQFMLCDLQKLEDKFK